MANMNEDRGFNTLNNSAAERRRKARTVQRYTLFAVGGLFLIVIILLVVMAVSGIVSNVRKHKTPRPHGKVQWENVSVTKDDTLRGNLALVNATHPFSFPENDEHLEEIYVAFAKHSPKIYILSGLSKYMEKNALNELDRMLTDFAKETGNKSIQIRYAYRTYKEQEELKSSTPAGQSDHHTGLGCDLKYWIDEKTYDLSSNPEDSQWLYDNAHKYGFIIRYPDDKADLTGIRDYTNYFRYVGIPHATYMKKNNLCMEEYITLLKEYTFDKPLSIPGADGVAYEVYYVAVDGETATASCPKNFDYTVSGTNDGGVVITVNRSTVKNPEDTSSLTEAVTGSLTTVAP